MDPELQRKIDEARAEGYSDQEIQTYLQGLKTPTPAEQAAATGQPVPTVENRDRSAEYAGMAQGAGASLLPAVATGAAAYGTYQGAKYLAPKIAEAYQNFRSNPGVPTVGTSSNPIGTPPSAGAQRIPISTGPVAPASAPAPAPSTMPSGRAYSPQAQQYMSQRTPPAPASQITNAQNIVQRLALDRVLKGGVGLAAALTPGNTGQKYNFPTSGRFAGQEINPMTGRPWTPQEIAQVQ